MTRLTRTLPPPPPLIEACAALLPCAALLLSATLALPAAAQGVTDAAVRNSQVLTRAPAYVSSLTTPLTAPAPRILGRVWTGLVQNLQIEAGPPQGTTTFGVGAGFRCAYGPGDTDDQQVVEFHNARGTYSHGQPIARACPTWGPAKCARTITFMNRSFTANRGYPPCPAGGAPALGDAADDTPDSRQELGARSGTRGTANGIFRVRVWGNFCYAAGGVCRSLKTIDGTILTSSLVSEYGYAATFRPGDNCGPARWPTPEMQAAGGPAYAEWCDVTVDVRR